MDTPVQYSVCQTHKMEGYIFFLGGTSFIHLVIGALGSRPSQVHHTIINCTL